MEHHVECAKESFLSRYWFLLIAIIVGLLMAIPVRAQVPGGDGPAPSAQHLLTPDLDAPGNSGSGGGNNGN